VGPCTVSILGKDQNLIKKFVATFVFNLVKVFFNLRLKFFFDGDQGPREKKKSDGDVD
jgi:hypothetical protein